MEGSMKVTATKLLWEDHRSAEELYCHFQDSRAPESQSALAEQLCRELENHCRLEEYLFYPALAREGADAAMVHRFGEQHTRIKRLISEVRLVREEHGGGSLGCQMLLARMMSLVQEHVAEEEAEALPFLKADPVRDEELGVALAKQKIKLKMIPALHATLVVQAPVRTAYHQWTQFEAFPLFLDDVKAVHQLDASHVRWDMVIAGREVRWTAEIYEQIPDERIAWKSVEGAIHSGSVTFQPVTEEATRMLVEISYDPQGLLEDLGAVLGIVERKLEQELARFKAFLETGSGETGAWRGRIKGDPIQP